jgi:hypothetical protein
MGLAMLEIEAYRNGANTVLGAKRQLSVCRVGCPVQIGYWALHRKRGECLATVRFGRSALWPADAESNVMTCRECQQWVSTSLAGRAND